MKKYQICLLLILGLNSQAIKALSLSGIWANLKNKYILTNNDQDLAKFTTKVKLLPNIETEKATRIKEYLKRNAPSSATKLIDTLDFKAPIIETRNETDSIYMPHDASSFEFQEYKVLFIPQSNALNFNPDHFIFLHELGHIYHQDTTKTERNKSLLNVIQNYLITGLITGFTYAAYKKRSICTSLVGLVAAAGAVLLRKGIIKYLNFQNEVKADQFAIEALKERQNALSLYQGAICFSNGDKLDLNNKKWQKLPSFIHFLFSSHPADINRVKKIIKALEQMNQKYPTPQTEAYLQKLHNYINDQNTEL